MRTAIPAREGIAQRIGSLLPLLLVGLIVPQSWAADSAPAHPWLGSEVVVKDLFVQPRVGVHVVNPALREHRYTVARAQGPWLWLTSSETSGWVHQNEVVPFAHAIDYFTAVIHSHPYSGHAYYIRGLVWADLNEPDIAIADFTDAIERDSRNAWAFRSRGNAYSEKEDYKKAIADYDEAVRLNALDAAAYNNRGHAHDRRGEYHKAIADYSEAIRRDPEVINTYYNRAGAYAEIHEDSRALVDYDRVIRRAPDDADARAHVAWLRATSHNSAVRDPADAIHEATLATRLSEGKTPFHWQALAAAHAASGQWDQAVDAQLKALALIPKDDAATKTKAEQRLKRYRAQQPAED